MKGWQMLALLGMVAVIIYVASKPSQTTVVQAPGNSTLNGILSGVGGFLGGLTGGKAQAPGSTVVVPNEGTYKTGFTPTQSGNTLTDPNTGTTLTYGTD